MITGLTKDEMVSQLCKIYYLEEGWITDKMSPQNAVEYHTRGLDRGNIIPFIEGNKIVGYVEYFRVNFEQLGRLVCHLPFLTDKEDTTSGNIAWINNLWVHNEWRNSYVIKYLKEVYFMSNFSCDYFVGESNRKRVSQFSIFRKDKLMSNIFKGEK